MTGPRTGPSDDQLLGGMAVGRLDALEGLYERYAAVVYGAALAAAGGDAILAEDRTREAFLLAWREAPAYPSDAGGAGPWLVGLLGVGAASSAGAADASGAVSPPPALRGRLLAAAYADVAERRHPAATPARRPVRRMKQVDVGGTMIEIPDDDASATPDEERGEGRTRGARRAITIGAAILVFIVGAWAFMLQQELVAARDARAAAEAAMELAAAPGSSMAALTGPGGAAAGLLVLGREGEVRVVLIGLASLPSGEVYAVWLRRTAADGWSRVADLVPDRDGGGAAAAFMEGAPSSVLAQVTREAAEGASAPSGDVVASGSAP